MIARTRTRWDPLPLGAGFGRELAETCRARPIRRALSALAALIGLFGATAVLAQTPSIHWAYAPYLGTGRYTLAGHGSFYTLAYKPRRELKEPSYVDGERRIGLTLRLPIAASAYDLDLAAPLEIAALDNVATWSAVPGVELDIPINERWSLKPLAYLGYGTAPAEDASAWIYWTGLKSRRVFGDDDLAWALVSSLVYVGYSPRGAGRSSRLVPLLNALEFSRPLASKKIGGDPVYLHWHVAYTHYLDALELPFDDSVSTAPIDDEWELGVAFGKKDKRLKLWRLGWDRVGLAYRWSTDGRLDGIRLTFHSLFDR